MLGFVHDKEIERQTRWFVHLKQTGDDPGVMHRYKTIGEAHIYRHFYLDAN